MFEDFWKRFELEWKRAKCEMLIRNPSILILALVIFDIQNSSPNRLQWLEPVALFVKYLINRTELIREMDGDVLDFAHKTFYEYFLAVYYAQEYDTGELLGLLDKDSSRGDAFYILFELYERNALQAKYHDQYYRSLLFHSDLVQRIRSLEEGAPTVHYNEQRTAELFLENVELDPLALYQKMSALKLLNPEFRLKAVSISRGTQYQMIGVI